MHVLDSASAPFGDFEHLLCAGLVDGEWPERPRRNIFYSSTILRELGWPAERGRADGARAAFADLLRSASREVAVSPSLLEHHAVVSLSPLVDEIGQVTEIEVRPVPTTLIFFFGYSLWSVRLRAIAFETIGKYLLRTLSDKLLWHDSKPHETFRPSAEKLGEMAVRAQLAS